jgi:hypothetical protein
MPPDDRLFSDRDQLMATGAELTIRLGLLALLLVPADQLTDPGCEKCPRNAKHRLTGARLIQSPRRRAAPHFWPNATFAERQ